VGKDRLSSLSTEFKRALSDIILFEMNDSRISQMTSVTHVELSKDLMYAKAYISVYDDEKKRKSTIETLTHAEHFIKNEIGRRMRIRRLPEIKFILDGSIEYSSKIADIIKKVNEDD